MVSTSMQRILPPQAPQARPQSTTHPRIYARVPDLSEGGRTPTRVAKCKNTRTQPQSHQMHPPSSGRSRLGAASLLNGLARGGQHYLVARALCTLLARGRMRARRGLPQIMGFLRKLFVHPPARMHMPPPARRTQVHCRPQAGGHPRQRTDGRVPAKPSRSLGHTPAALLHSVRHSQSQHLRLLQPSLRARRAPPTASVRRRRLQQHSRPRQPQKQQLIPRLDSALAAICLPAQPLHARLLAQGIDEHPLTQQQQLDLAEIAHRCLHFSCSQPDCLLITPGQPFRLNLLQAFAARMQDPDAQLADLLRQGQQAP